MQKTRFLAASQTLLFDRKTGLMTA